MKIEFYSKKYWGDENLPLNIKNYRPLLASSSIVSLNALPVARLLGSAIYYLLSIIGGWALLKALVKIFPTFGPKKIEVPHLNKALADLVSRLPFISNVEKVLVRLQLEEKSHSFFIEPGQERQIYNRAFELISRMSERPLFFKIDTFIIPKPSFSLFGFDLRGVHHFQVVHNTDDLKEENKTFKHRLAIDFSDEEKLKKALIKLGG